MSGNVWMFSEQIDDEDMAFMAHEFVTYNMACDYYGLGLKLSHAWLMSAAQYIKSGRADESRGECYGGLETPGLDRLGAGHEQHPQPGRNF